jgi:hypothetical protein
VVPKFWLGRYSKQPTKLHPKKLNLTSNSDWLNFSRVIDSDRGAVDWVATISPEQQRKFDPASVWSWKCFPYLSLSWKWNFDHLKQMIEARFYVKPVPVPRPFEWSDLTNNLESAKQSPLRTKTTMRFIFMHLISRTSVVTSEYSLLSTYIILSLQDQPRANSTMDANWSISQVW